MEHSSGGISDGSMSNPKHPLGKWGSACAVCSAAKAKCTRSDPAHGAPCDRCKRLSKQCTNQVHHPRKRRSTRNTRTSQLEERLNGLVDLLRASGKVPIEEETRRSHTPAHHGDRNETEDPSDEPTPSSSVGEAASIYIPPTWNSFCPPRCICSGIHGNIIVRKRPDDEILDVYQRQLMPHFPFVIIPPGTRAHILKAERPLLFAAISMAASISDINSMRAQMYQLIQRIANELLIASARSMEIIQTLLIMLAWHHNHCIMHAQMVNLLHLAQAQVTELRLDRETGVQERTSLMVLNPKVPPPRTNEEKRAILGVWFVNSGAAITLYLSPAMKFSKYFKKCLSDLQVSPQYESDILLVHLIKIQRLAEQISDWSSRRYEEDDDAEMPAIPRAPTSAYQSVFEGEIQALRNSLPPGLQAYELLQTYIASLSLRLYQPPPIKADVLKALVESPVIGAPGTPSALDIFYRAQSELKAFFNSFVAVPTKSYPVMPVYVMLNIIWSIPMLARWAKIMGPVNRRPYNAQPDILTPQKVVWDPSSRRQTTKSIFGAGFPPVPSFDTGRNSDTARGIGETSSQHGMSKTTSSTAQQPPVASSNVGNTFAIGLDNIPPAITDPSQIPTSDIHDAADADIPRLVTALKVKLYPQSGLDLDIIGILSTLAQRCEQAHKEIMEASPDGSWNNNNFYIFSKKILIARAKLAKWAEIVAGGGRPEQTKSGHAEASRGDRNVPMGDAHPEATLKASASQLHPQAMMPTLQQEEQILADFQKEIENAGQDVFPPGFMDDSYTYGNLWTDDMFGSLDPGLWLNDGTDWNMALFRSSATMDMEQAPF